MRECSVEAVVISLLRAFERRKAIAPMLQNFGFRWSFFDAHAELHNRELRHERGETKRYYGRELTIPQIAVYSSHYTVWKQFLDHGSSDFLLVLEDDIIFDAEFPFDELGAFCSERSIDYIRLFGKHYAKAVWLGFFYDRSIIRHKTTPTGMQGYMLSRKGAKILTEKCRDVNVSVDIAIDSFWRSKLPIYSIHPYPIIERYSTTSIPIPPLAEPLSTGERFAWNSNRAYNKFYKAWANVALRSADRRIRDKSPPFQQIFRRAADQAN